MWNKKIGAQVLLYGAYVGAVLLVIGIIMMLIGGTFMGGMLGSAGRGFMWALVMSLIYGIVGGFMLWIMYSAGSEYLSSKVVSQWKAWVVLVLATLGALGGLRGGTRGILSFLINIIFIYGAAALLWAPEE